jgi:hypothetical protein
MVSLERSPQAGHVIVEVRSNDCRIGSARLMDWS